MSVLGGEGGSYARSNPDSGLAHLGAWEVFGVEGYDRVLDLRGSAQREQLERDLCLNDCLIFAAFARERRR